MISENAYTLNEDAPISDFLQYYAKEKTRTNARIALYHFLATTSDECLLSDEETLDRYGSLYLKELKAGRNHVHDLLMTGTILMESYAPATIRLIMSIIMLWMEDCGYPCTRRERQRIFLKLPPAYSIRNEAELTRKMFQSVYYNLKPVWARVLLLVLLGSGMRIGETLSIRCRDVDWTASRVSVYLHPENTKTWKGRTIYLTREGADALRSYLETRQNLTPDSLIFPYSVSAVEHAMRMAVDNTRYGKQGRSPRQVHWHMTRKWFISRFSLYASKEVAEELAGHEGYLSKSYQRFTKRQILSQFSKAEKYLILFPETGEKKPETPQNSQKSAESAAT